MLPEGEIKSIYPYKTRRVVEAIKEYKIFLLQVDHKLSSAKGTTNLIFSQRENRGVRVCSKFGSLR